MKCFGGGGGDGSGGGASVCVCACIYVSFKGLELFGEVYKYFLSFSGFVLGFIQATLIEENICRTDWWVWERYALLAFHIIFVFVGRPGQIDFSHWLCT